MTNLRWSDDKLVKIADLLSTDEVSRARVEEIISYRSRLTMKQFLATVKEHSHAEYQFLLGLLADAFDNSRSCTLLWGDEYIWAWYPFPSSAERIQIAWQWQAPNSGHHCDFLVERSITTNVNNVKTAYTSQMVVQCQSVTYHKRPKDDDRRANRIARQDGLHTRHWWASAILNSPLACARELTQILQRTAHKDDLLTDFVQWCGEELAAQRRNLLELEPSSKLLN